MQLKTLVTQQLKAIVVTLLTTLAALPTKIATHLKTLLGILKTLLGVLQKKIHPGLRKQ